MANASPDALRRCARSLDRALEQRDCWIASMRRDGASLRAIARAAELTPAGVQHVLGRTSRTAKGPHPDRHVQRWATEARKQSFERARLLLALHGDFSERELAEFSGLSRTAVRYQITRSKAGATPQIVRARG